MTALIRISYLATVHDAPNHPKRRETSRSRCPETCVHDVLRPTPLGSHDIRKPRNPGGLSAFAEAQAKRDYAAERSAIGRRRSAGVSIGGVLYCWSIRPTLVPGGTIASIRSSVSSESCASAAARRSSSCSIVRGPMSADVTPGCAITITNASARCVQHPRRRARRRPHSRPQPSRAGPLGRRR